MTLTDHLLKIIAKSGRRIQPRFGREPRAPTVFPISF